MSHNPRIDNRRSLHIISQPIRLYHFIRMNNNFILEKNSSHNLSMRM